MTTSVYKTLSKIFGIVCLIVGIGALSGGLFAASFIKDQLGNQDITMPTEEAISKQLKSGSLTREDVDALTPYAGQTMTNGNQAKAFANHYIAAHMRSGAERAGYPDATYNSLGSAYTEKEKAVIDELTTKNPDADETTIKAMAAAEIANPMTSIPAAKEAAAVKSLRFDTMLNGNSLRGMLLNAYGWGLVGTIARWVGIGLIIVGLLLGIYGFVPAKKN